ALAQETSNKEELKQLSLAEPAELLRLDFQAYQQQKNQQSELTQVVEQLSTDIKKSEEKKRLIEQKFNHVKEEQKQQESEHQQTEDLLAEKVIPLDSQIAQNQQQVEQLLLKEQQLITDKQHNDKSIEQFSINLKQHQEQLVVIDKQLIEQDFSTALSENLPLWKHQYQQLTAQQKHIKELDDEQLKILEAHDLANKAKIAIDESLASQQKSIKKTSEQVGVLASNKANLLSSLNCENEQACQQSIQHLQNVSANFSIAINNAQRYQSVNADVIIQQTKLQAIEKQFSINETNIEKLRAEYRDTKRQRDDVFVIVEQQKTIMSLTEHRNNLQPEQDCPLCGAKEHPLIEHYQNINTNDDEQQQRLLSLDNMKNQIEQQGILLKEEQAKLVTEKTILEQSTQQLMIEQQTLTNQWLEAQQLLMIDFPLNEIENITAAAEQCEQQLLSITSKYNQLNEIAQQHEQLKTQLLHDEKQQSSQQNQLNVIESELKNHDAVLSRNRNLVQTSRDNIVNEYQLFIQSLTRLFSFEQLSFIETNEQLMGIGFDFSLAEPLFTLWTDQQNQLLQQNKTNIELQKELINTIAQTEQGLAVEKASQENVTKAHKDVVEQKLLSEEQQNKAKKQREELVGLASVNEIRTRINEAKNTSAQQVGEIQKSVDQVKQEYQLLLGKITTNKNQLNECDELYNKAYLHWEDVLSASIFDNENAFTSALMSTEKKQQLTNLLESIKEQKQQAETLITQHKKQINNLNQEINTLKEQGVDTFEMLAIDNQLNHLSEQLKQDQFKQGQLKQQLTFDQQQREKQADMLLQISAQQLEVDDLSYLNGLVGSSSGDKFRRFAQGLTLEHLVYLANKQLNRLHARYQLQCQNQDNLALEVIDTWQADNVRDTKTLSGGESFLVSLALALALSDLASAKTSIDSLFLDEGFGTLDNDTLEIALDALDNLNANGKMIGVISHVDTLKDRIGVQIKVHKKSGLGFSELDKQFAFITEPSS
ncbi:MAG: hypothetical protein KC484_09825, partial [Colwelliaceae bacterium]|nr:hypothetical protein [Colwelliaceae bacterium]